MVYQIHTSTPCRPGIPSASDYIFPISPSTRNALLPPSILKKPAHSIGSNDMISSQSSDANTASSTSSQNNDRIKLFFVLKLYKSRNPSVSLDYLDRTSFMRLVIYSFWFLSVMLMLTAVLLLCVLNPSRGTISKGVALSLGASAMLFCSITTLKTICFWSRSTSPSATADTYKNFSTLV
ncbi:unnamed protein product [Nippostrongylus brasiliensis]|uniref:Expressed conserved protein n=1 Tax=Nippostrongylus brasiliensis TaxID=27835 RepID=A0A0N4XZ65_NIPBR|nr:unnamed protein product [Nippostrongylus brasiliensis]